ncbi:MAG: hypothetical protein KKG76_02480, partial [Euryarchaeota archaeon]|nr:hypothetical protein [Euryarchaeota archaeon]
MTKEMLEYEDTLKDIEKPSWKSLGEIDMERVRFLLSTDEMIEEMLRTWGQGVENPAPFEGADESYPLEQHFHTTNSSDIYSKNNGMAECEKH